MTVALKFIHIVAIAIWSAGLIALPGLYVQRAHVRDEDDLFRLQNIVRYSYVAIISPAAFIAVASGIALIFLQQTFDAWFSLKLTFVGVLAIFHTLTGLVIVRLFKDGEIYPVWRFMLTTALTAAVALTIVVIVLVKPQLDVSFPSFVSEPGALRDMLETISPWTIP
ncbi:CopD family protein [Limoniibacter endophyticus]|uniref:Protoporphyrinogen IX oxidase n=1 Tax=Limoniibacter endophyticus TaxID=1565040 RepID=A0A8J3DHS5_9HYPH|nr:CopD family protein [Limoniibacter endophyticus]GHC72436.1 hypothetical protein GCM10010136_20140 [Limoniibacter endophyticus]